jgi:membrane protease YdiL (CAAX protease family)
MVEVITVVALLTPLVCVALMGVIGYPLASRRPDGMARFHRSGFTWWLISLVVVACIAALTIDDVPWGSLAGHETTVLRWVVAVAIGFVLLLAIESAYEVVTRRSTDPAVNAERERYESSLPAWASSPRGEIGVLSLVAVLEEGLYRGVGLAGLIGWANLSKPVAAGIVSVAFGAAHWYFGPRQMWLKAVDGGVLCFVAFTAGWPAAAAAHVLMNVALALLARRAQGSTVRGAT